MLKFCNIKPMFVDYNKHEYQPYTLVEISQNVTSQFTTTCDL